MGHGLNYWNVQPIVRIAGVEELNIGHSIVSRAVLVGMERAVREMKQAMTEHEPFKKSMQCRASLHRLMTLDPFPDGVRSRIFLSNSFMLNGRNMTAPRSWRIASAAQSVCLSDKQQDRGEVEPGDVRLLQHPVEHRDGLATDRPRVHDQRVVRLLLVLLERLLRVVREQHAVTPSALNLRNASFMLLVRLDHEQRLRPGRDRAGRAAPAPTSIRHAWIASTSCVGVWNRSVGSYATIFAKQRHERRRDAERRAGLAERVLDVLVPAGHHPHLRGPWSPA